MGCHIFDPVFEALALTSPLSVRSEGPVPDQWQWAINARIRYVFPGTPFTAEKTLPLNWYDGDERPPADLQTLIDLATPAGVAPAGTKGIPNKRQPSADNQGSVIIGTAGVLHVPHRGVPKLHPAARFADYTLPEREQGDHWQEWANACMNGRRTGANFDYSGPLTEAVLLGCIATRFPNTTLAWNVASLQFDRGHGANHYLRSTYRKGWEVAGL